MGQSCVRPSANRSHSLGPAPLFEQVGGLGLTLTAADRVVIADPAWNPSVDNQVCQKVSPSLAGHAHDMLPILLKAMDYQ